ncbi:uncharacterized protein J7T54_000889 [Emericellopsis cladophorae]|uniref:Uncharacterized protein n=1 Tax=Emericellopsis cladophorae TaxID=2686198 RepID=A0A9P9Y3L6_9HYPO|nr:uncharacterized protein J7T54_000889 [Emericellopsis cladophorae]KAI6782746.1 hypothetical protein J7T54_000889 [Emericellopsis cladophorae]
MMHRNTFAGDMCKKASPITISQGTIPPKTNTPKPTTSNPLPEVHPPQALVTAYLTAISTCDIAGLPDYFSPTATWWTSGNPLRTPSAGGPKPVEAQLPVKAQACGVLGDIVYLNNISSAFAVKKTGRRAGQ